jgi:hypothetical protein
MPLGPSRFRDALAVLVRHDVRFVVVGGVAAALGGAPVVTLDLDIVHERAPENVARLLDALAELDARYRDPGGRVLRPEATALLGPGHHLLATTAGPVDVLGEVVGGSTYTELLEETTPVPLDGHTIAVLGLAAVIRLKEALGRDKDRAMLAILRRALVESEST